MRAFLRILRMGILFFVGIFVSAVLHNSVQVGLTILSSAIPVFNFYHLLGGTPHLMEVAYNNAGIIYLLGGLAVGLLFIIIWTLVECISKNIVDLKFSLATVGFAQFFWGFGQWYLYYFNPAALQRIDLFTSPSFYLYFSTPFTNPGPLYIIPGLIVLLLGITIAFFLVSPRRIGNWLFEKKIKVVREASTESEVVPVKKEGIRCNDLNPTNGCTRLVLDKDKLSIVCTAKDHHEHTLYDLLNEALKRNYLSKEEKKRFKQLFR